MNLTIPNINISDGNNKEIVDTLHRYRKELNFLLMNLDESNMPAIAGRLDGIDGSFSLIQQDLDAITLAVGNAQGDISALELRADGIDLAVSNNAGSISALSITVDGISSTVSNQAGQISTINQTVSGISTTVYSATTGLGAAWSAINQNANAISLKVSASYVDNAVGDLDDDLTGAEIALRVNQAGSNIKIQANHIDLIGITTLYSGQPNGPKIVSTANGAAYYDDDGDMYLMIGMDSIYGAIITAPERLQIGQGSSNTEFNGYVSFTGATISGLTLKFA